MIARTSDCPNFFVRKRGFLSFNLSRPAGNLVGKKDKAKLIEKAQYTFPTKKSKHLGAKLLNLMSFTKIELLSVTVVDRQLTKV